MIEYVILGFLMYGEMSGYDIKQYMSGSTANFFDASFGSIYPILKKLEATGFVRYKEVVDNGKFKKLYSLNDSGRERFMKWLAEPVAFSRTGHGHLAKFFFFGFLESSQVRKLIEDYIGEVQAEITHLNNLEKEIEPKADLFQRGTVEFGILSYRATLEWCRGMLSRVSQEREASAH